MLYFWSTLPFSSEQKESKFCFKMTLLNFMVTKKQTVKK